MSASLVPIKPELVRAVAESLAILSARTNKRVDHFQMKEWVQCLSIFSVHEVSLAFVSWASVSSVFPAIVDIVNEIHRCRSGGLSGAWVNVCTVAAKLQEGSRRYYVVFDQAAAHFALNALGGFQMLLPLISNPKDRTFAKRDFESFYRDYRPGVPYPSGFGTLRGSIFVFIGDTERAKNVCSQGVSNDRGLSAMDMKFMEDAFSIPSALEFPPLLNEFCENLPDMSMPIPPWMLDDD